MCTRIRIKASTCQLPIHEDGLAALNLRLYHHAAMPPAIMQWWNNTKQRLLEHGTIATFRGHANRERR